MNTLISQNFIKSFLKSPEPPSMELKRRKLRVVYNENNEPTCFFGRNAVVFKLTNGEEFYALKCYITDLYGRWEYLHKVQAIIQKLQPEWIVNFRIFDNELEIEDNDHQKVKTSIIVMPWVEEMTLADKIKNYCQQDNTNGLKTLTKSLLKLANQFIEIPFSHGDVSPENIMVTAGDDLMLIDHDSFSFTNMGDYTGQSKGSISYLHPYRNQRLPDFNADDFSFLVLTISLKGIELNPGLYHRYTSSKGLLLNIDDFISPQESKVISELKKMDDPYLNSLLKLFLIHLNKTTTAIPYLHCFLNANVPLSVQNKIDADLKTLLENNARQYYLIPNIVQQKVQATVTAVKNQRISRNKEVTVDVISINSKPPLNNKIQAKKIGLAGMAAAFLIFIGGDLFFGNHNIIDRISVEITPATIRQVSVKNEKPVDRDQILVAKSAGNLIQAKTEVDAKFADKNEAFIKSPSKAIKADAKKLARQVDRLVKKNKEENTSFASNTVTFRDTGF